MYPEPKKSFGTLTANIFVTLCILIFAGVIIFGIMVTKDGGAGFRNLVGGSDNSLKISK